MKTISLLFFISIFMNSVFCDEVKSVSVKEGDSVTLHTDFTDTQTDDVTVLWTFGPQKSTIAKINSEPKGNKISIYDDVLDGRFRDRLQLNNQTGDLTITNITTQHTGVYEVEITVRSKIILNSFNVNGVINPESEQLKSVSVKDGDSVTLHTDVPDIKKYDVIQWRFKGIRIAHFNKSASEISEDVRFRDKLHLDVQTGSLKIKNIRTDLSGLYEVEISSTSSSYTIHQSFTVTVSGEVKSVSAMKGDPLIIYTDVPDIKTYDQILLIFGNDDKRIADVNKLNEQFTLYGRIRDGLKLNDQTGDLTITDITTEDAGLYELKMSSRRRSIQRRFSVNVSEQGLSPGAIAGISVITLLVIAAAAGVIYYRRKKAELKRQLGETKPAQVDDEESKLLQADVGESKPSQANAGESKPSQADAGESKPLQADVGESKPSQANAGESKPSQVYAGESKPSQADAGESKPLQTYAGELKPSQTYAGESKPSQVDEEESKPSQADEGESKPSQADEGESKPSQADEGESKPSQVDEGESKPSQANEGELKPSQANEGELKTSQTYAGESKPSQADEGESKPSQADEGESKPSQANVGESKLSQADEGESKPSQANVGESKPSQVDEGESKASQTNVGESKQSQANVGESKQSQANVGESKPSQVFEGESKPSQANVEESKPEGMNLSFIDEFSQLSINESYLVNGGERVKEETHTATASPEKMEKVSVNEGESHTLKNNLTDIKRDDVIEWSFNETLIAPINPANNIFSTYEGDDDLFRDKLKLNPQTGDLTINDIRQKHNGVYKLKIIRDGETSYKRFSVSVRGEIKTVFVDEGESVNLKTEVTDIQRDDVIEWRFGFEETLIAEINPAKNIFSTDVYGLFRGKLKLNPQTGDLNIKDITEKHSGVYKLKITKVGKTSDRTFRVFVKDE